VWTSALAVVAVVVARVVGVHVATIRGDADAGLVVVRIVGVRFGRSERAPELPQADSADDVAGQAGEDTLLAVGFRAQEDAGSLHGAEEARHGRGTRGGQSALLRRDDDEGGAVGKACALPIQVAGEGDSRNSGGNDTGRDSGEQGLLHGLSPIEH
jgi:hypothetical protein